MKNSNVKKTYLKSLKSELGKMNDIKRAFLSDVSNDVQDYFTVNPSATVKDLEKEFGTPAEISAQFIDKKELASLKRKAKKYFWLRIALVVVTLVALLFILIFISDERDRHTRIEYGSDFEITTVE